ncbi:hypothetical protein ACWDBW_23670 [Streptomyces sp. NPDC001107]
MTVLFAADDTVLHRDGRPLDVQIRLWPLQDTDGEAWFLLTAQHPTEERPGNGALLE